MPVGSLIVLSCLAFLGIYHFVQLLLEESFGATAQRAVLLIPLDDGALPDPAARQHRAAQGEKVVFVDLTGALDVRALPAKSLWCDAIATPETLGETALELLR